MQQRCMESGSYYTFIVTVYSIESFTYFKGEKYVKCYRLKKVNTKQSPNLGLRAPLGRMCVRYSSFNDLPHLKTDVSPGVVDQIFPTKPEEL